MLKILQSHKHLYFLSQIVNQLSVNRRQLLRWILLLCVLFGLFILLILFQLICWMGIVLLPIMIVFSFFSVLNSSINIPMLLLALTNLVIITFVWLFIGVVRLRLCALFSCFLWLHWLHSILFEFNRLFKTLFVLLTWQLQALIV